MDKCTVCQTSCVFKRRPNGKEGEVFGAPCDACKSILCKDCANLTTSETDAIIVQNRVILFFCQRCKTEFPNIDQFGVSYDKLLNDLRHKENYISHLEDNIKDLKSDFRQELDRVTSDNKMKDDHIRRLQRRTQTIDEEVFEAEKGFENKIQLQKQEICNLNKELAELVTSNLKKKEEIESYLSQIKTIEVEVEKLKALNQSVNSRLSSLSKDNNSYIQELVRINKEKDATRKEKTKTTDASTQIEVSPKPRKIKSIKINSVANQKETCNIKKRILLLSDQMGRGLDTKLDKKLSTNYSVQSIIKPFALLEDIIESVSILAKDFNSEDHIVVFAGYNNFCKNVNINVSYLMEKLKSCINTNIIVLSTPICFKLIAKCNNFNFKLKNLLYSYDKFTPNRLAFINSCEIAGRKHSNYKLSELIYNVITYSVCKNLTYVKLEDNINNSISHSIENFISNVNINSSSSPNENYPPVAYNTSSNNCQNLECTVSNSLFIDLETPDTSNVNFYPGPEEIANT